MRSAESLMPLIFPDPEYGDFVYYQECWPVFAESFLLGCFTYGNLNAEEYVLKLETSYREMLSKIASSSISQPALGNSDNSVIDLAQEKLLEHVSNLECFFESAIVREIAREIFEQVVTQIERQEVLEMVKERLGWFLHGHGQKIMSDFLIENWFIIEKSRGSNKFAQWCQDEFQGANFKGEHLDEVSQKGVLTFRKWKQRYDESLEGLFVNGRLEGKGKQKIGRRIVYKGEFKAGLYHGKGKISYPTGETFVGDFKLGEPNGCGVKTLTNGLVYDGEVKNGNPHGQGTLTGPDGSVYEGEWQKGLQHGQGKMTTTDGHSYEGEWQKGLQHGQGTYTWPSGHVYEGEWQNGKQHGQGTHTWANGSVYEGEWQNDKQHGQGTHTWANHSRFVGTYQNGERIHGELFHDDRCFKGAIHTNHIGDFTVQLTISLEDKREVVFIFRDGILRLVD